MTDDIHDIISDPEALLALEPEELAGVVLEFLNTVEVSRSNLLNSHNFSLSDTVRSYPREKRKAILEALMEAWIWLEREGLIAPKPGSFNEGWIFITRRGRKIADRAGLKNYQHSNLLPKYLLHPIIAQKVWSAFIRQEYDTAVFQAFKEVEVAVREKGNFLPIDIGEKLMRKAFDVNTGPLTDLNLPEAERAALQHLFAGAIGSYKNPQSHRNVSITDPTEAVEMIIIASHLLRIVDSRGSHNPP